MARKVIAESWLPEEYIVTVDPWLSAILQREIWLVLF